MPAVSAKRCFVCDAPMRGNILAPGGRHRRSGCDEVGDAKEHACWHVRYTRSPELVRLLLKNLAGRPIRSKADRASQRRMCDMYEQILALLQAGRMTPTSLAAVDVGYGGMLYRILIPMLKRAVPEIAEVVDRAEIYSMAGREIRKFRELQLPMDFDVALRGFAESLENERSLRHQRGWRGKNQLLTAETAAGYVKGAAAFLRRLHELGVQDLRLITQHHLDVFAMRGGSNNSRTAAVRFIRWAKSRFGLVGRFIAPKVRRSDRRKPVLSEEQLHTFLRDVGESDKPLPVRSAALLCALYGQPIAHTLALTLADLDLHADKIRVAFGRVPITLDSLTARVLRQWLAERQRLLEERGHASSALFPSAVGGDALKPATLRGAINRAFGYSPVQLRATALHNAVRGGIRDAQQLAGYFGCSIAAARRALMENGRSLFEATPEGAATLGKLMRNELAR